MTPRRTTNLNSKEKGDKSLFVKREVTEDVYVTVLQRLSDMAKAKLPKSQYPAVEPSHPSVARPYTDAIGSHEFNFRSWYALTNGR